MLAAQKKGCKLKILSPRSTWDRRREKGDGGSNEELGKKEGGKWGSASIRESLKRTGF